MQKPGGKRLVSSKSGLKIINQHDTEVSPFELSEPQWQLDSEVQSCSKCDIKFTFLNRRHHCRRCGLIFCKNCTSEKLHLHRMAFVDPVRVCQNCHEKTKPEEAFFLNEIKVLHEGAPFHVSIAKSPDLSPDSPDSAMSFSSALGSETPKLLNCKLTSDQRFLVFHEHLEEEDSETDSIEAVELGKILEVTPVLDDKKQCITMSLRIKSTDDVQLAAPPEPSRKPSVQFLTALQQGIAMILNNKKEEYSEK